MGTVGYLLEEASLLHVQLGGDHKAKLREVEGIAV